MNKSDLTKELADEAKIREMVADGIVRSFFDEIETALAEGRRVEIRGFGSFAIKQYKAYQGRNPKSGESVGVAPKTLPVFRAGRELKAMVNKD